jgi:hypothetical protein
VPRDGRPTGFTDGYIHHAPSESSGSGPEYIQEARWGTLESTLDLSAVQQRINQALQPRQPFAYGVVLSGCSHGDGFLFRFKVGEDELVAEVQLGGWEGGTQVHVALPADHKREEMEPLLEWLRRVLSER